MTSSNIYKSLSNIDISYLVISSLSVSDTDKYLEFLEHSIRMRHDDINYLRGVRKSPVSLFSKLVDDPERLLGLMTENKVILSGSRAVSFMYPLFSSKNSDWDFYCPPLTGKSYYPRSDVVHKLATVRLSDNYFWDIMNEPTTVEDYLTSQGAVWHISTDAINKGLFEYDPTLSIEVRSCVIKKGNKVHKIQFVYPMGEDCSGLSNIIRFHSSVVQCFITGFSVVSMYDVITNKELMIPWSNWKELVDSEYESHVYKIKRCVPHTIINTHLANPLRPQIERHRKSYEIKLEQYKQLYSYREAVRRLRVEKLLPALTNMIRQLGYIGQINNIQEKLYAAIAGRCRCNDPTSTESAIEKYKQRGFSVISPHEYLSIMHYPETSNWYLEARNLSDDIAYTYMFNISEEYGSPERRSYLYSRLLHSSWYEYGGYDALNKHEGLQLGLSTIHEALSAQTIRRLSIPRSTVTMGGI